jgi:GNAT superfamily N-acetyltransferase
MATPDPHSWHWRSCRAAAPAEIPVRPGARRGYGAVVRHGDNTERAAWRVASGEPAPAAVERLLRLLPGWFGIESSVLEYVEYAQTRPAYLAWPDGQQTAEPSGVLLAARHFPSSAEIYLMAVDPAWHRRAAGRALVAALEADLIADGVEFLQVKTQGPAHPDAGYAKTRQFYASVGFQPLEEIYGLWPGLPCLIMIKSLRTGTPPSTDSHPGR